jgi:Arc/MetJ-type ribon-helix-helix transcriptional regulator
MANTIVSVRLPAALLRELKDASKKDHFLDTSETVRSIVRNNWLSHKDPLAFQVKQLRKEISQGIAKKNQEEVLRELRDLRDSIIKKDEL